MAEDGTVTSEWTEQTSHSPPKDIELTPEEFERNAGGSRKFPVEFKLKVIDYVKAGHTYTATARHFKVNRKVVRDWMKKEDRLREAAEAEARADSPDSLPRIPGALGHYPWAKATTVKELLQEAKDKRKAKVLPRRAIGRIS